MRKTTEATAVASVEEPGANGSTAPAELKLLNFDEILAADDTRYETVPVPEWGGAVRVVSLTGEERNKIGALMNAHAKQLKSQDDAVVYFQARIVAASLVDADGKRIGAQSKVIALSKKNGAALARVYEVCSKLSGIGEEEVEKATEDLGQTPSDVTGTG